MDGNINLEVAHSLAWESTDIPRIVSALNAAEIRGRSEAIEQVMSGDLRIESVEKRVEDRTVALVLAHIAELLAAKRADLQFSSGASGYYAALNALRSKLNDALPDSRRSEAA